MSAQDFDRPGPPRDGRGAGRPVRALVALAFLALAALLPARAGALAITATYDTSITNHPQASTIIATINTAIAQYQARIVDPVTVQITFQRMYSGLGGSNTSFHLYSYSTYLSYLQGSASSTDDAVALSHVPLGPSNGLNGDSIRIVTSLGRKLGLNTVPAEAGFAVSVQLPNPDDPGSRRFDRAAVTRIVSASRLAPEAAQAQPDGVISLNLDLMNLTTNPTPADKYGLLMVVSHEIDEVLGSSSILTGVPNGNAPPANHINPEDLFRYSGNGTRGFTTSLADSDSTTFSLDGVHQLVRFNQLATGDASDWWSNGDYGALVPRVQDAFATKGADPALGVEWRVLDALGWSMAPNATWVDFNAIGVEAGTFLFPYHTLASGVAATPSGGLLLLKGSASSAERPVFSTPMTMTSVRGPVTIGQ